MPNPSVVALPVTRLKDHSLSIENDLLAVEEPMEIRLGYGNSNHRQQKSISVTMRTPGNDFELALWFLFTEWIVSKREEVKLIRYCTNGTANDLNENIVRVELDEEKEVDIKNADRNFYTTSSCGICGKTSIEAVRIACKTRINKVELKVHSSVIIDLPQKLVDVQSVFKHTGGLHASALFKSDGTMVMLREDIGRHNALDKLIGAALKMDLIPLDVHLLLLSGRASFELIQKAAMAGIRIVAAVGAPSSLAVSLAKEFDMTLTLFKKYPLTPSIYIKSFFS